MGQRKIRVGELVKRELSELLHSRWRSESVAITITEADVAPDLRSARIYYAVLGNADAAAVAGKFLASIRRELRFLLGQTIILKYTPELRFILDSSADRAMKIMSALDALDAESPLEDPDCDGSQHEDNP